MHPRDWFFRVTVVLALTATAQGRLGETVEECINRYGPPTFGPDKFTGLESIGHISCVDDLEPLEVYRFDPEAAAITAVFYNGKAQLLYLRQISGQCSAPIPDNQVEAILDRNLEAKQFFRYSDSSLAKTLDASEALSHLTYIGLSPDKFYSDGKGSHAFVGSGRIVLLTDEFIEVVKKAENADAVQRHKEAQEQKNRQSEQIEGF